MVMTKEKFPLIFLWVSFLLEEKSPALLELQRQLIDLSDSDTASSYTGNHVL